MLRFTAGRPGADLEYSVPDDDPRQGGQAAERGRSAVARELEKKIDEDLKPRSREIPGWTLTAKINIEGEKTETKNVIGVLEGAGPHAKRPSIIGGHYDHLGHGGHDCRDRWRSSRRTFTTGPTTMPRARRWCSSSPGGLAARRDPLPRRVVFMAFSGEERGLLGSQYYVEHPLFPLDETVMMINCDMVGRLNAKSELTMVGTGSTQGIDAIVDALGQSAGLEDQESRRAFRRVRRQRSRIVLREGRPGPLRVHRAPRRLPPAQRRFRPDQLHRDGPHRRLPRADHARRGAPARAAGVRQARRAA